jgi:hypothetical protein
MADDTDREASDLLVPDPVLGVPLPAYGGRSLPNVTRSVVDAVGATLAGAGALAPPLAPPLDPFAGRRAEGPIVVLLVDALGWPAFARWASGRASAGDARWRDGARPITSIFSTTTTAALVSLSTGAPPGRTGVVGYRQYLPAFGLVADLLRSTPLAVGTPESLVGPTWTPGLVSGVPNVFARGLPAVALSRASFQGSGFTRLLYEGAEFVGYATATDLAHLLTEVLRRPTPPPAVFAYWDELDTIQHLRGPHQALIDLELDQVARALRHVARAVSGAGRSGPTLLLTADHGQVPADRASLIALDQEPELLALLARPPAGDRRAGFFEPRPGRTEALREALRRRLPPGSRVLDTAQAAERGLFGPPPFHPELHERLGGLIALVPSPAGLGYTPPGRPAPVRHLAGAHGGLEPAELLVPLFSAPLASLA